MVFETLRFSLGPNSSDDIDEMLIKHDTSNTKLELGVLYRKPAKTEVKKDTNGNGQQRLRDLNLKKKSF